MRIKQKRSLTRLIFQGKAPASYTKSASKTLIAGFLGVMVGSLVQYFLNFFGYPIILTYWMGALVGFIVNFRFQVMVKNIRPDEKE